MGLVNDQGTPLISDPGYKIVSFITSNNYKVISLPGPTAFVPALTISAIAPQPFIFYGFLNSKKSKQVKELDNLKNFPYTMIFYESPHRIMDTLNNIKDVFGDRSICIVREISKKFEEAIRGKISEVLITNFEIKGEFVVVVAGANINYDFEDISIVDQVELYLNDGMSKNDAIKLVAKERKMPKSIVYKEYHEKGN